MGNYVNEIKKGEVVYDIHDKRVGENAQPARIITLEEGQSIEDILDNVKSGDIAIDETTVILVVVSSSNTIITYTFYDDLVDTIIISHWNKENDSWTEVQTEEVATMTFVNELLMQKANLITLEGSQTIINRITSIHKGYVIVDSTGELAYFCYYETEDTKGFISIDDTGTVSYSFYVKTNNAWNLDSGSSWDFNPKLNKGTKLYKHRINLPNKNQLTFVTTRTTKCNINTIMDLFSNGLLLSAIVYYENDVDICSVLEMNVSGTALIINFYSSGGQSFESMTITDSDIPLGPDYSVTEL